MKCRYTYDRNEYNSSHAVLFRVRRLKQDGMPGHRWSHQKWVFYETESPAWVKGLAPYQDMFNLTSTYQRDSDIPVYRGRHFVLSERKLAELTQNNVTFHEKKSKLLAWFVSRCMSFSQREIYVRQLRKYVPVDIYGECGSKKCGSRQQVNRTLYDCDTKLLTDEGSYKFYLSFENSLCDDYVTEKLWTIWNHQVIPVVYGGVDYASMLPERTYLSVADFLSPKALASYLKYLDEHHEIYNDYMRRKVATEIKVSGNEDPYHCRLCHYLHVHRFQPQIIKDIVRFWSMKTRCHHPLQVFKNSSEGVKFRKRYNALRW